MFTTFKRLFLSRKFWVGVFTGGANAAVSQMDLNPETAIMFMKAVTFIGTALIGGIAYEDGKTKEFGTSPEIKTVKK